MKWDHIVLSIFQHFVDEGIAKILTAREQLRSNTNRGWVIEFNSHVSTFEMDLYLHGLEVSISIWYDYPGDTSLLAEEVYNIVNPDCDLIEEIKKLLKKTQYESRCLGKQPE